MDKSEEELLSSFLLSRSTMRDIMSLSDFTRLFPPDQRENPIIRTLYKHLQDRRTHLFETVAKNIRVETHVGRNDMERIKSEMRLAKRNNGIDLAAEQEIHGFAGEDIIPSSTIISKLRIASEQLQVDIERERRETIILLNDMKRIVGDLSDLRYGNSNPESISDANSALHQLKQRVATLLP